MTSMSLPVLFIVVMAYFSAFALPFVHLVAATRKKESDLETGANIRLTPGEIFWAIAPDILVCGVAIVFILLGADPAAGMHALAFVFCYGLGTACGVLYSRRRSR